MSTDFPSEKLVCMEIKTFTFTQRLDMTEYFLNISYFVIFPDNLN